MASSCVGDVKKLEKTVEMLKKECCSLQEEIRQYELKEAAWKDKNMRMEGELVVSGFIHVSAVVSMALV